MNRDLESLLQVSAENYIDQGNKVVKAFVSGLAVPNVISKKHLYKLV